MMDKFREECGLIGIWNHPEAGNLAYLGLCAQQHRGQEGAGVLTVGDEPGTDFKLHRGRGLVMDVFSEFDFATLPGKHAIGHVRYTTAGTFELSNVQPFYAEVAIGRVGVAHNGNLINQAALREELISDGAIFASSSDSETFLHLLARPPKAVPLIEAVIAALTRVHGAYSLLLVFEDRMVAVRDPNGFRPLVMGTLDNGGYVFASETCAFDLLGATYIRDVQPGEMVEIKGTQEPRSYFPFRRAKESPCIFEYVYFSRPDSRVFERTVYPIRKRMGIELAREHPTPSADMVVPVPDSGVTAAIGYAQEAGLPLEMGLIRNHYIGRTFIEPKQSIRDFGVKIKLNPNPELLEGKSLVVVDDSIVRGTTSQKLIKMLRKAGAREVHMRISAPPTTDPCYYGIDTPKKNELIASSMNVDEIASYIGVDSLAYLSLEGLYRAVQAEDGSFCDACFSGTYPIGTPRKFKPKQQEFFAADEEGSSDSD